MELSTTTKNFAIAAITALALGIAPAARANNMGCSNATLKGTFAHIGTGFTTAPPSMAGPLNGVGTDTFDGNGNITGTATLNLNGVPVPVPVTEKGTYKVNPDCTGSYTVQFFVGGSPSGSTNVSFVIADSGNEIHGVCTDQGSVTTHTFLRQFPAGDWRQ
jgi:hypothetical protein